MLFLLLEYKLVEVMRDYGNNLRVYGLTTQVCTRTCTISFWV